MPGSSLCRCSCRCSFPCQLEPSLGWLASMVRNGAVCFASQKQRPPSYPTFSFSFVVLAYSASDVHQSRLAITLIRFHERPPLAAVAEQRRPCARRHKWEQQTWGRCGFGNADGRRPLAGGTPADSDVAPPARRPVLISACRADWRPDRFRRNSSQRPAAFGGGMELGSHAENLGASRLAPCRAVRTYVP